jgi:hypothetical protein
MFSVINCSPSGRNPCELAQIRKFRRHAPVSTGRLCPARSGGWNVELNVRLVRGKRGRHCLSAEIVHIWHRLWQLDGSARTTACAWNPRVGLLGAELHSTGVLPLLSTSSVRTPYLLLWVDLTGSVRALLLSKRRFVGGKSAFPTSRGRYLTDFPGADGKFVLKRKPAKSRTRIHHSLRAGLR